MSSSRQREHEVQKKALKATWYDSDKSDSNNNSSDNELANLCFLGYINESDTSEDEYVSFCPLAFNDDESVTEDLCLMSYGDEVTSKPNSLEDESYSYDELQNAFEELAEELASLVSPKEEGVSVIYPNIKYISFKVKCISILQLYITCYELFQKSPSKI